MSYEVKREELTEQQWQEMREIAANNVCGVCGAELQIHTNPEKGTIEVGCLNREHHGYIERTTYTQEFRRGTEIHPAIRDNIERRMILPGGQPVGVALSMIQTRFPRADMDEPSAALFLWDCVRLDLDPLLGEIFPATFRVKGKDNIEHKVVQPIISEDGWLSLAARSCAEAWAGSPKTMRLEEYLQTQDAYKEKTHTEVKEIAREIKTDLCRDPEAYVWVAIGHRKDQDDTIAYGWYKKSEEGVVAKNLPGNQARVRAIKRWVREVFPEAKAKMKEMTATWMERAGDVRDIQNVIEAEYHIITEGPPPKLEGGEKTGAKEKKGAEKQKSPGAPPAARRDPATVTKEDIPDLNALAKVCFQCWGMQPTAVWRELGYSSMLEISEGPWDCWLKIKAVKTS
ncbi:unnamed protein product [marine sediment metagenome]|uniref:Uncharacterized protein n=1 Tax=marine sediment metagenome TaxID=412755 RepID=X1Q9G8_9ZZZZ